MSEWTVREGGLYSSTAKKFLPEAAVRRNLNVFPILGQGSGALHFAPLIGLPLTLMCRGSRPLRWVGRVLPRQLSQEGVIVRSFVRFAASANRNGERNSGASGCKIVNLQLEQFAFRR